MLLNLRFFLLFLHQIVVDVIDSLPSLLVTIPMCLFLHLAFRAILSLVVTSPMDCNAELGRPCSIVFERIFDELSSFVLENLNRLMLCMHHER